MAADGLHLCTGRALALIELDVAFASLWRRLPTLRLAVPFEEIPSVPFGYI